MQPPPGWMFKEVALTHHSKWTVRMNIQEEKKAKDIQVAFPVLKDLKCPRKA